MSFLSFEQIATDATVKDVTDLTIPANATHAEIQADTNDVRYTMDGSVPSSSVGMLLVVGLKPKTFVIDDVREIQFIQGSGGAGNINLHYFAGRDV